MRARVTREPHQPVRHKCGYDKWWSTAATPDSNRMTQVSLFIALNNFVPLHRGERRRLKHRRPTRTATATAATTRLNYTQV